MITRNIIETVTQLKSNGVEFLRVPESYYEVLPGRVGEVSENMQAVHGLGILVDRDDEGYLLRIFTKPSRTVPRCSWKLASVTAHKASAKAILRLSEALEMEQEQRGNL